MRIIVSLGLLFALLPVSAADPAAVLSGSFHRDHRNTPRLQFTQVQSAAGQTVEAAAWDFLAQHAATYKAENLLADLQLYRIQESLLGTHLHFQQHLQGYPVYHGEIVVSIDHKGTIYQVYNNLYPVTDLDVERTPELLLDEAAIFDAVWQNLHARGEVLAEPQTELMYLPQGKSFRLVFKTFLKLDDPEGEWVHFVDARDAAILDMYDSRITRKPVERVKRVGPTTDRVQAFERFSLNRAAAQAQKANRASKRLADGSGLVFDPDPRTTLMDDTLQDTDPESVFVDAYVSRDLLEITLSGGIYSLAGPWIELLDFDSPTDAPETSTDGTFIFNRDETGFTDVMTYFHIDQSQRYMQSLGFTGATGIQFGPIGTDANGAGGADNSFYSPGANQMSFGHGCVDDNEDADVILHEYGHAIHYSINSNWGGGDSGAIGEGFGDYWAGSYSISTLNGDTFMPEKVYSWDGHGTPETCWPGRFLNRTDAQYDPNRTYGAHVGVGNFISDELWSAPIFRALLELIEAGRTREEADQIVLQSHFGMGSGVTMRDLGQATVATAAALFPQPLPHVDIYTNAFASQNIIDLPRVQIETASFQFQSGTGENGVPDPGETVTFLVQTSNVGLLGATDVSATLTSTNPNVTILQGSSVYPDMTTGLAVSNSTPFQVQISESATCGDAFEFVLTFSYTADGDNSSTPLDLTMQSGAPSSFLSETSTPALAIPDDNPTGVTDTIDLTGQSGIVSDSFSMDIDLTHTFRGDLFVRLTSAQGTTVVLHNQAGGSAANILGNYPNTLTPEQSLAAFNGESVAGVWTLFVSDNANNDVGTLNSWTLNFEGELVCDNGDNDPCLDFQMTGLAHAWWFAAYYQASFDRNNDQVIDMRDLVGTINTCAQP